MAVATILTEKVKAADAAAVEEVVLDGHKIRQLTAEDSAYLARFKNLKSISMNQTYLTSVANFPHLPKLESLELTDNRLGPNSALETLATSCPKLSTLILAGNRLTSLEFMDHLKQLEVLDIEVNPITANKKDEAEVRKALFDRYPSLKIVNSHDRDGNAIEEDESEDDDEGDEDSDDDVEKKKGETDGSSLLKAFYEQEFEDDDELEEDFDPESFEDDDDDDEDGEDDGHDSADEKAEFKADEDSNTQPDVKEATKDMKKDHSSRKRKAEETVEPDSAQRKRRSS